jgi:pyrroloquinoline-quinone synthase
VTGTGELEARLRGVLDARYHHRHPFNLRMHEGRLTRAELQTWVRNRYYYQTRIPIKDGAILAKAEAPAFRRAWIQRIHDHDGRASGEGGLERWLDLAEAVGLARAEVQALRGVLPGVREACDDYVRFVDSHDLLESVASSLTELRAGEIMQERLRAFEEHYAFVGKQGLRYFRSRTGQAPRDAAFGLRFVLEHAVTREDQDRVVAALERKCEILWRLLDAVEAAGRRPRLSRHAALLDEPEGSFLAVLPERAVRVNATGREILGLCTGEASAEAIAAELARRYPATASIEDDVHGFLAEMEQARVLESAQ